MIMDDTNAAAEPLLDVKHRFDDKGNVVSKLSFNESGAYHGVCWQVRANEYNENVKELVVTHYRNGKIKKSFMVRNQDPYAPL